MFALDVTARNRVQFQMEGNEAVDLLNHYKVIKHNALLCTAGCIGFTLGFLMMLLTHS